MNAPSRRPRVALIWILWAVIIVLSTPLMAVAGENDESPEAEPDSSFGAEIQVTGVSPEIGNLTEIDGSEIQASEIDDLAAFTRTQPGMAAIRRGSINLDPQVRGLQETQVGVFVDGTRTFAAGPGRMDSELSHVSPHAVDRMRVVKGPYALAWGAGAMSAIQVDTYRPPFGTGSFDLEGRAGFRYGENAGNQDAYATLAGANDVWRFNAVIGQRTGDDYETGDGQLIPGDYESFDSRWVLGRNFGDSTLLEYSGGFQQQDDIDFPGRLLDATYFHARSHVLELNHTPALSSLDELYGQVYVNNKDHLMNNDEKPTGQPNPGRMPPFPIRVDLPAESDTSGARFHLTGHGGDWRWQAGGDYYRLKQTATRTISNRLTDMAMFEDIVWPDAKIEDLGFYGQGVWQGDGVEVAGTLRLDLVDASAGEASEFFLDNTVGDLDQSETNFSAALSGVFQLADSWSLTAGVGRAVRTASAAERYSDRIPSTKFQVAAEFMGDPLLDPESSLEFDLGARFASARIAFVVNAFYREIDDYITVLPDPTLPKRLPLSPDTVYRYITGDKGEFYGGEITFNHQLLDIFSWRASLSYIRGNDTFFDEPIFGLSPLVAQIGARYDSQGLFWIDLNYSHFDEQTRVAAARFEKPTPGAEILDLWTGLRLIDSLDLKVGATNLTDEAYSNHLNSLNPFSGERIPEIGRSLRASVEYRF